MSTDTSEKGLETLVMRHMTGEDGLAVTPNMVAERQPPYGDTCYTANQLTLNARKAGLGMNGVAATVAQTKV